MVAHSSYIIMYLTVYTYDVNKMNKKTEHFFSCLNLVYRQHSCKCMLFDYVNIVSFNMFNNQLKETFLFYILFNYAMSAYLNKLFSSYFRFSSVHLAFLPRSALYIPFGFKHAFNKYNFVENIQLFPL